jgi:cadmium resistance transport/sequestration family protein
MNWFAQAMITGITSFAATNLDDIIILMLFFSQVDANFRPKHVVWGQYLGFSALIVACLPGFFGGLVIPKAWIGLLGFIPIAIGVKHWLERHQDEKLVQTVSQEWRSAKEFPPRAATASGFFGLLAPPVYQVAAVTFANGGDNIGIYVPLFASSQLRDLMVILSVFFILIGVWCSLAYQFTRHPTVAHLLTHYGQAIVPFVLVGLGLYILIGSGTYHLLQFN